MIQDIKIIMCGSELSVKGGMVSVIKNYIQYGNWGEYKIKYIPTHTEKNKFVIALFFLVAYLRVVFTAIFGHYDILYLHTAEKGSFYRKAILARTMKLFGIKTILHHHAAEFEEFYERLTDKRKKFVNETLETVDLNIVLSNLLISNIIDKAPNANVKVLYNAVRTYDENPYNQKSQNILFLGKLGERKGVYDLLRVIKMVDKSIDKNIQFYLCGDGDVEEVKKKIQDYQIEHRIAHVGWVDGEQKNKFIKNTMINILPSYNEGLPMSILETMAYGIPNISTNIASIPEVINDGITGYLTAPGDVENLCLDLMLLCSDAEVRKRISQQSWVEITRGFALDENISKLKKYIKDLVR